MSTRKLAGDVVLALALLSNHGRFSCFRQKRKFVGRERCTVDAEGQTDEGWLDAKLIVRHYES